MDTVLQDLRYAVRTLTRSPGFTLAAGLALAVGIGANTAVFSVVRGVLLRPLAYDRSDRLYVLFEQNERGDGRLASYPTFHDWVDQSNAFSGLAFVRGKGFVLRAAEGAERLGGAAVSSGFFSTMGAHPLRGRVFTPDEESGGAHVAVITYELWQERFGGRPDVVDSAVTFGDATYIVIGVLPQGFRYPVWADLYVPISTILGTDSALTQRGLHVDSRVVGRLKPGITPEQGTQAMSGLATRIAATYPKESAGWTRVALAPIRDEVLGFGSTVERTLLVLAAAVGCVLLIACANVANLSLVRAATRAREIAIRTALGAGRIRVVRQLGTESAALALLGAVGGVLLALWGVGALKAAPPVGLPRIGEIAVDGAVLVFSLGVSILTAVLVGLAPAVRGSAPDLVHALKEGTHGAGDGSGRSRLRATLVTAEVALTLVLLVGAGLLIRSFWRLSRLDPGFNPERVVTLDVQPPRRYVSAAQVMTLYRRLVDAVAILPGVQRVALSNHIPLSGAYIPSRIVIPGRVPQPGQDESVLFRTVSAEYFRTMEIPVRRGRPFDERDMAPAAHVALVNEALARRDWPQADPVGHQITLFKSAQGQADFGQPFSVEVIGVIGNVRHIGLDQDPAPEVYIPYPVNLWGHIGLIVKTTADPRRMIRALRRAVLAVDPDIPVVGSDKGFRTMEDYLSTYLATRRFTMTLLAGFAACALLLSAIGIYGVIAYAVAQRTREIGIRTALGARPREVARLVLGQSMRTVALGLVVGVGGALAVSRLLSTLLYGVGATDPLTFIGVTLLLAAVAALASYVPARRATRVDPIVALRYE